MEWWAIINIEDIHLASICIYYNATSPSGKKPCIVPPKLTTNHPPPQHPTCPVFSSAATTATQNTRTSSDEPDSYKLEMVNDATNNQIVVTERPKGLAPSTALNTRAQTTILTGRIKHECNLRPVFSEWYRRQMKERSRKYNILQRQIRMIEEMGYVWQEGWHQ